MFLLVIAMIGVAGVGLFLGYLTVMEAAVLLFVMVFLYMIVRALRRRL